MPTKTLNTILFSTWACLMVASAQTGTWNTVTTPSSWDTNSNWTGSVIASGSDNSANFNQLDIAADTTVNLTTPRVIGHLNFDDTNTTTAGSWILSGGSNTLTLAGTSPTIYVDVLGTNKSTTINAQLLGTSGFTKTGDGKLILNNSANTISGVISLSLGTLEYMNAGSLGTGSLSFTGNSTLRAGVATTVARAMNISSGITATYDTNGFNTTLSGSLTGSGTLTKSGNGILTLTGGVANTFTGPIMVNQGILLSMDGTSHKNVTGPVTVASGAVFFYGQNFSSTNHLNNILNLSGQGNGGYGALHLDYNANSYGAITLAADTKISHSNNNASIHGVITGTDKNLTLSSTILGQGALTVNGNISLGTGTVTKTGAGSATLNGTNTYSSMLITEGLLYFENPAAMGGTGANITIQDNGAAARNGADLQNLLSRVSTTSTGAVAFGGASTTSSVALDMTSYPNLSIGSRNTITYSGTITPAGGCYRLGGGGGVLIVSSTLTGSNSVIINDVQGGTVSFSGIRNYTGDTIIKSGILRAQDGVINHTLTLQSGGTLGVGPSTGIGNLTVSQPLNMNGKLQFRINRLSTQNADFLTAPSINFNGTLVVKDLIADSDTTGTDELQAGDTFQLWSVSGSITRTNLSIVLPTLNTGLEWDLGSLFSQGIIKVVAIDNVIGYPDFPELLPAQLAAVKATNNFTSVTINPGTYNFANDFSYNSVITLTGWTDFTINADNVLFTLGKQRAFVLNGCTNVKIKGLTVRARYPSATQGKVLGKGVDQVTGKAYAIWKISDGYPAFETDPNYESVDGKLKAGFAINAVDGTTKNINQEASDTYGCILSPQGDNTWRVDFPNRTSLPFDEQDWLVTRIDGSLGQSHAIFLSGSTNCTIEAVRSQGGGFATFYEIGGGGNKIKDCTIECSPVAPVGTEELQVVSCAADGIHARDAYPGLHVENLTTTGVLLDDCIAIHGFFHDVTDVSGNTITVSSLGKLAVNDFVRISHDITGYFAQATCTGIVNLGGGSYRLTLNQTLPIPKGSKVCNPKYDGDGFRILNCKLSGTRSRAIIAKADNGVISGCTFQYSGTAVRLGSDYHWNESGYGWNVVVENNTVMNCRMAVDVHADGARGNKNITIRNNNIGNTISHAIAINGCDGVTISGNNFGVPASNETIYFRDSANVTLSNNLVAYATGAKSFLKGVANVTNLQGQSNGMLYSDYAYALTNSLSGHLLTNPFNNASGESIQQYTASNASSRWKFESDGTGYVKIISAANGLVIGVNNSSTSSTPLVLEASGNGDGQRWTLRPVGTNKIELVNKLSGHSATATSGTLGETIKQITSASSTGQQWTTSVNNYSYSNWISGNGANADPYADDDKDGLKNIEEYAFATDLVPGANPMRGIIAPINVDAVTNNYFTLEVRRRANATDISFTVEHSNDLLTWTPSAVLVSSVNNPDGTISQVWRVPTHGAIKGFLRVRIDPAN